MNPSSLVTQVEDKSKKGPKSNATTPSHHGNTSHNHPSNHNQSPNSHTNASHDSNSRSNSSNHLNTSKGKLHLDIKITEQNENLRDLVNSPRESLYVSTIVPWKSDHLLPPTKGAIGKKCLVLDLDETLVHSSFKPVDCDFIVPIQLEGQVFQIYVAKRPHVDEFMKFCGKYFEVVVFTASLATYADAVLDLLDIHKVVDWRLFRDSCSPVMGTYVKDMNRMGRDISSTIIIDNSPHSYAFNPLNAIPCQSWFDDRTDTELLTLIPILEKLADPSVKDVKVELQSLLEVTGMELINSAFSNVNLFGEQNEEVLEEGEGEVEEVAEVEGEEVEVEAVGDGEEEGDLEAEGEIEEEVPFDEDPDENAEEDLNRSDEYEYT